MLSSCLSHDFVPSSRGDRIGCLNSPGFDFVLVLLHKPYEDHTSSPYPTPNSPEAKTSDIHIGTVDMANQISDSDRAEHVGDWPNDVGFHTTYEQRTPLPIVVTGVFPPYATGNLYRIGPGARKSGDFQISHWFDGYSVLHKFDIHPSGLSVTYTSRSQVDGLLEKARRSKRLDGITFAQKRDPCDSFFKKIKTVFTAIDQERLGPSFENIGVAFQRSLENTLSTTSDKRTTKRFDATTLEPLGLVEQRCLHPALKGQLSGAHPQIDPQTGDIYNYNLEMGPSIKYRVFKTCPGTAETSILATVQGIRGAYIHSLFLTSDFVVLCIWPSFFNGTGLQIIWNRNILDALDQWSPTSSATWLVIDRKNGLGVVKRFTSPGFFAFHTTNAWQTSGSVAGTVDITCELAQFENMDILKRFYYDNLVSNGSDAYKYAERSVRELTTPQLARYRLEGISVTSAGRVADPKVKAVLHTARLVQLQPRSASVELPTISPLYICRPHRYVFGIVDRGLSSFVDALGKVDMHTGQMRIWSRRGHSPGEAIFIPKPNGTEEDDGVLLSVVLNGVEGNSYLLCLDAKDMSEIAKAEVSGVVGLGFHGLFC